MKQTIKFIMPLVIQCQNVFQKDYINSELFETNNFHLLIKTTAIFKGTGHNLEKLLFHFNVYQ